MRIPNSRLTNRDRGLIFSIQGTLGNQNYVPKYDVTRMTLTSINMHISYNYVSIRATGFIFGGMKHLVANFLSAH